MAIIDERRAVIRHLAGDPRGDKAHIVCPACGCEITHIRHVGTLIGFDLVEAEIYDGTVQSGSVGARRSTLEIVFRCERCPKLFAIRIDQHEGNSTISIETDVPVPLSERTA